MTSFHFNSVVTSVCEFVTTFVLTCVFFLSWWWLHRYVKKEEEEGSNEEMIRRKKTHKEAEGMRIVVALLFDWSKSFYTLWTMPANLKWRNKSSVAWKSGPSHVLWFWRIKFLEENRQKKSNHQNVTTDKRKEQWWSRTVVGNQTGSSLLMFVANDGAK